MILKKEKIYYNTEYRKKIKALSKFNIFINIKRCNITSSTVKNKKARYFSQQAFIRAERQTSLFTFQPGK